MNNLGILKKVAEELSKESPKLDYVRGMIDTLIEMQEATQPVLEKTIGVWTGNKPLETVSMSESEILDAQAKAALAKTMELSNKSLET